MFLSVALIVYIMTIAESMYPFYWTSKGEEHMLRFSPASASYINLVKIAHMVLVYGNYKGENQVC